MRRLHTVSTHCAAVQVLTYCSVYKYAILSLDQKYHSSLQFLRSTFAPRLGSIIHGQIDSFDQNVIYTRAFLSRHRARVTGATRGVTRPTPVATLLQAVGCEPRIFFAVLDDLIETKKVAGELCLSGDVTLRFSTS